MVSCQLISQDLQMLTCLLVLAPLCPFLLLALDALLLFLHRLEARHHAGRFLGRVSLVLLVVSLQLIEQLLLVCRPLHYYHNED